MGSIPEVMGNVMYFVDKNYNVKEYSEAEVGNDFISYQGKIYVHSSDGGTTLKELIRMD